MKTRRHACVVLILCLALVTACRGDGGDTKPEASIVAPADQQVILLGETLRIESQAKDDKGLSQLELRVDGTPIAVYEISEGEKTFRVTQSWLPPEAGIYQIVAVATDSKSQQSDPAAVYVTVQSATTPTPTSPPSATPTFTPTPQGVLGPDGCVYAAKFVTDVTIPDNTQMEPGTEFVKTWRIRNSGTCHWGTGLQLVFVEGQQMGGAAAVNVPPTPAGATVDISVHLQAPLKTGAHRGIWRLRLPDGREFGDRPFIQIAVAPPVTATPTPTLTATPAPKPDLDITLISGDLELLVGEPLTLRVTVRNHGPAATDQSALLRAVLRAGLEVETSVPSLAAGREETAVLSYTFDEPVELQARVSVDADDRIAEENEANNTEQVPVVVNPPLYVSGTLTTTVGLRFDLDDGSSDQDKLDIEWQVVEGTVQLGLLNGAGAALISGPADSASYALVAGLTWENEQLTLDDLAEGLLFGYRTSEGRIGYARVDAVLDGGRSNARLAYLVWDWPQE